MTIMNLRECPPIQLCKRVSSTGIVYPMTKAFLSAVVVLCLISFSLVSTGFAQVDRSALSGTVIDPSGRVVPQTHVTAQKGDSGFRREATTSSTRTYDIPELPVGVYTIIFEHEGFKA